MESICFNCFQQRGEYEVCPYCGHIEGTPNTPEFLLQPKTRLWGRYLIGTVLGIGGFGVTYRAWDARLATVVAIKEFFPQNLASRIPGEMKLRVFSGEKFESFIQQKNRFLEEGKNLAKFNNDSHIVNVLDCFEDNGSAYIVMEYLDGDNLKQYLEKRGGTLPMAEVTSIMEGLLQGIASIHKQGIIHRDISPDNIYILRDGMVKILDFGAARFVEKDDWTQSVVVKKGYAPPEQYRSNMKQSELIDLYAAGATWYKLLTGKTPEESIERWERDVLEKPSQLVEGIDIQIDKAIMKSMALRPELRFKSAEDMLAAVRGSTGFDFPEEELKKRRRIRSFSIVAAISFLFATLGVAGWQISHAPATIIEQGETLADMDIQPDQITLWVSEYDNETGVYDQLAEEFMQAYPQHSIEVVTKYDTELGALYACDNYQETDAPDITTIGLWYGQEKDVDYMPLLNGLDMSNYYWLEEFRDDIRENNKRGYCIPLGQQAMVAYGSDENASLHGITLPTTIKQLDDIWNIYEAAPAGMDVQWYEMVRIMDMYLPEIMEDGSYSPKQWETDITKYASVLKAKDEADYDENQYVMFVGETGKWDYERAMEEFHGNVRVIPIESDGKLGGDTTDNIFVNGSSSENEQLVCLQFVHFLLSEKGQELLHVYHASSMPLNKNAMDSYFEVYPAMEAIQSSLEEMEEAYYYWIDDNWDDEMNEIFTPYGNEKPENYVEMAVDAFMNYEVEEY
ncbi:MAG: protein kinase [Eubacteriales bacterium]